MTIVHKAVKCIKEYLEQVDKELEHKAQLKEPFTLPATMTAEEALCFIYYRYFGDEPTIDTGPAIQSYPVMANKICHYIDHK